MALLQMWQKNQKDIEQKKISQIIAFCGDGKLKDVSAASKEFREFLMNIPSTLVVEYLSQCLESPFADSGLAFQDIVNEIGRRIGFKVDFGRYRGSQGKIGHDGKWTLSNDHNIIIEVKTTDAFQIDLDTLIKYKRQLVANKELTEDDSSVLIIVGKGDKDTKGLEAQIRGSRYAWDIRIISADALVKLLKIKQNIEDPNILEKISNILIPYEYTKLDEIINLVFFATEDVREEIPEGEEYEDYEGKALKAKKYADFQEACIEKIEKKLSTNLIKRTRSLYSSPDESKRISLVKSQIYEDNKFRFVIHPHQLEYLNNATSESFVTFGCGSEKNIVMIPLTEFNLWLKDVGVAKNKDGTPFWNILISEEKGKYSFIRKKGLKPIELSKYML